jgi:hypothetical protein
VLSIGALRRSRTRVRRCITRASYLATPLGAMTRAAQLASQLTQPAATCCVPTTTLPDCLDLVRFRLQCTALAPEPPFNTRAELEKYDPALCKLLSEVLPDKPRYRDCYYYP